MSVLICFALKEEAARFRKIAGGWRRGHHISILLTGIGRQNAEKSLREFLGSAPAPGAAVDASSTAKANDEASFATREGARAPQLVLTCGFAGGLNPDLKLGDVVFELTNALLPSSLSPQGGERVSARTGLRRAEVAPATQAGEGLSSKLLAAGAKPAKFFCADRIATTAAEKKKLRDETGADAVEMESAAIHAVCAERGIPCAIVRVISDTADEDLPLDFNALAKPDKSLDYGKLLWAIAKSPGKTGALMKLQKQTRFAAERLAEVLAKII
jgi:uridine phosphorylase